jgi:hypothetical protein
MYKNDDGKIVSSRIICITGPIGSGKTSVADALVEKLPTAVKLSFATPLKELAIDLGWNGKKDERGRRLLQHLGTDVCRDCIDQDYWSKKMLSKISDTYAKYIVIDDARFDSEIFALLGTHHYVKVIKLTNKTYNKTTWYSRFLPKHRSEKSLHIMADEVDNSGMLGTTVQNILDIMESTLGTI